MTKKLILDVCCGSKMFWFDKENPLAVFMDNREVDEHVLSNGRRFKVKPDILGDFKNIPFPDNSFRLVIFDPPHLKNAGHRSYMAETYGVLPDDWETEIRAGFHECMRVLDNYGILVFKWSETDITVKQIIDVIGMQPLIGHKSGKSSKTHWLLFMKIPEVADD
jgi:ubiquinone/menaquinone biosynthesis C-methylase UbiE